MNTAVTSETVRPARLVIMPAPDTNAEEPEQGNVVKLPVRARKQTAKTNTVSRVVGSISQTDGSRAAGAADATGSVAVLDPVAAERAVVRAMSCKVAQASLEVLCGVRSIQQLSRWLSTKCLSALTTRARLHAGASRRQLRRQSNVEGSRNISTLYHQPLVHSVHCSAIAPGIYETSVVIADKTRFRAIAMRFERTRGLWKVTALQIG